MYSRKGRVAYLVVSSLIVITGFYNSLVLSDPIHTLYSVVAAALYLYLRGMPRLLTGFSWCLLSSGLTQLSTLLSVALSFLLPYSYEDASRKPSDTHLSLKLASVTLVFTPLYLLRALTLITATSYLAGILVVTFISYVRISKSRVVLHRATFSAYLGDYVEVPLIIESGHEAYYKVLLDDNVAAGGFLRGSKHLTIKLSSNTAGVRRHSIKVVLSDLRGFSRVTYGPYLIRVKAVPKSLTIVRSVREILNRYVELVKPPIIYLGKLEVTVPSRVPVSRGGFGGESASGYVGVSGAGISAGLAGGASGEGGVSGGQGLDSGVSKLYGDLIKYRFRWAVPAKVLEFIEFQTSKTFLGDYAGVREYYPGDHPRSIHWKKSVSTGELAVKVYTRGGEGGGGRFSLVIADWDASNPVELDNLIQATYSALLMEKYVKILYLKLPNGKIYLVKGGILDVLKALDFVVSSEDIESRFDYESWVRKGSSNLIEELKVANEPLRSIDRYYRVLSESLIEELERQGLPKNSSFVIVHPRAHTLKYLYLTHMLRTSGYTVTHLTKILQPSEISKRLKEMIKS
jgi:hypothetical protein